MAATVATVVKARKVNLKAMMRKVLAIACVAGGMRERARPPYFSRAKPARNFQAAKPRVKFPPATFRMVFACRPFLSLLMNQLNKPIRERSVT